MIRTDTDGIPYDGDLTDLEVKRAGDADVEELIRVLRAVVRGQDKRVAALESAVDKAEADEEEARAAEVLAENERDNMRNERDEARRELEDLKRDLKRLAS